MDDLGVLLLGGRARGEGGSYVAGDGEDSRFGDERVGGHGLLRCSAVVVVRRGGGEGVMGGVQWNGIKCGIKCETVDYSRIQSNTVEYSRVRSKESAKYMQMW